MGKEKIIIIGLDGASWDILNPLIEMGKMPSLMKIVDGGTSGILKSTVPPLSPPAWISMFTGKNPGKHGVFDFIARKPRSYRERLVSSADIDARFLWEIIGDQNIESCIINVPITYPGREFRGCMVTGMLTPDMDSEFTCPSVLRDEVFEHVPSYEIDFGESFFRKNGDGQGYFKRIYDNTVKRITLTQHLVKEKEWDLFVIAFTGADRLQHFLEFQSPDLASYYSLVDGMIGELLIEHSDATFFVVSDHGFRRIKKDIFLNHWFEKNGYLSRRRMSSKKVFYSRIIKILELLKIKQIIKGLMGRKNERSQIFSWVDEIDWDGTKAYMGSSTAHYVYLNMKGREPHGIVEIHEYEKLRGELIASLKELKDPESGEKLFQEVYSREEIYHGPLIEKAPDIFILSNYDYYLKKDLSKTFIEPGKEGAFDKTGDHDMDGIFAIYGPEIKKDKIDASIYDITPTILYAMNLPVPSDMDGIVLKNAFKIEREVEIEDLKGTVIKENEKSPYSHQEEEKLKNRLKDLGYL